MTGKILKIALNNVFKQKRRSFFNMLTFAANALALIVLLGLIRGQYNMMFDKTIDYTTGHFKIYNKGYLKEKKRLPLDIGIKDPGAVIAAISGAPHFVAAAPRIVTDAMISNVKNKTNIMVYGVDFEAERKVTSALDNIDGNGPQKGKPGILIGKRLSTLLKTGRGDPMLLFALTRYKANNLVDVKVDGVYTAGFDFMERNVAYIDYDFARQFLDMEGEATEIRVKLDNKANVPAAKKYILAALKEKFPGLILRDWTEEAPDLMFAVEQDMVTYGVIFGIMLFMAIFIIINTLTITVFERTAEIGTLRAIGLQKEQIKGMFVMEGLALASLGILLGWIAALPLVYYMNVHGIILNFDSSMMKDVNMPFDPVMFSKNTVLDWLIAAAICYLAAVIGSIFPANKAAETNIVDALKKGVR